MANIITTDIMKFWYKKYNQRYFNNRLPQIDCVEFKIGHSKHTFGRCTQYGYPKNNIRFCITLSKYYNRTDNEIKTTFIHELIHIYEYDNFGYAEHKHNFLDKAKEIYKLSNGKYNITPKSTTTASINENYNKKNYVIIFKNKLNNCYGICLPNSIKFMNWILLDFKFNSNIELINFGAINGSNLIKPFRTCRSRIVYYNIDQNECNFYNSKIIKLNC